MVRLAITVAAYLYVVSGTPAFSASYDIYLIPLTTNRAAVPGALGSLWVTELIIHNRTSDTLKVLTPACDDFGPVQTPTFCWTGEVPPGVSTPAFAFAGNAAGSGGAFAYVPRDPNNERTPITLRVRDLSRNAQSFGTTVPTPRDRDFLQHVILTGIPTDPRYRATLRIYSLDSFGHSVVVRVYTLGGTNPIEEHRLRLRDGSAEQLGSEHFVLYPAYAEFDPLSSAVRAAGESVRIEIEDPLRHIVSPPPPPIWAMASITNNETQQVTIVAP